MITLWPSGNTSKNKVTTTLDPDIQTETAEESSVFGTPWYIPDIAESSVVRSFKFRPHGAGRTLIAVSTISGSEYSYEVDNAAAQEFYMDLDCGASPGSIWNDLRDYVRATLNAPAPEATETVSITGPASSIGILRAHATNLGLTVS